MIFAAVRCRLIWVGKALRVPNVVLATRWIDCGKKLGGNIIQQKNPAPVPPTPAPPTPVPPTPEPEDEIVFDVTEWTVVPPAPVPEPAFDFVPKQFMMEIGGKGSGDLCGWVRQGGIGLGDPVYINGDYSHPYTVYSVGKHSDRVSAKQGEAAELFLTVCPKKILRNARMVTGAPDPVANAYNYPGTVREYFAGLLRSSFPQYEIRENVADSQLNIPVNFMFYLSGRPVAAVFLIDRDDSTVRYQVKKAARLFALDGISCTHFFDSYRNDMPYVIQRVQGILG